ncbi:hypothetical protein FSP39_003616 [Pinctada imbricata]|uniref:Uncharacterized protein n=1 Tax=Pinctada imbricata TaxID=66713 RepID=A0AA89C0G5_PINIB|nr:hypothetical protein FSP39_003616 [Pinctada imbricata]
MTMCGDDGQQTLGMLSRHMWEAAHSMCGSDKCNPTLAAVCNAERNALFAVPLMRIKESKIMCDALKMATACVARHTMHCEAKDIPLLAEDQATSHWLMGHICKDERPNTVLQSSPTWDAESLMAISVLLRNPHVNKEALCPAYNVLMSNLQSAAFMVSAKEYAEMQGHMYMTMSIVREYCMDDMSMGWMGADLDKVRMANTTAQCNMTALFQCGMEADLYNKMTASIFYGWQPVCSALEKMICCVEHATGGCRDHKHRLAAAQAYREAFSMVGNHCPVEQISEKAMYSCAWPKPKKCELVNAIEKCLPTISTNDDKNKICSDLPTITTCVKEYTEGCTSTQAAPLVFILKKYKEWKQSDCDLSRTNVDITPVDSMNNITKCHMDSMEVMYNGIMRSTNMSVVMCQAVVSVYDCYSKLSYLPLEIQYRLTAGENDAHMLEMCRNMTRDQTAVTLPAESPNCMLDMASLCFVPYLVHLTDLELTPVHERMEYCSKILDVGYCMMSAVSSCSSQRQEMMTAGIEVLKEQFQRVCPNILPAIAKMDYVCAPETAESCISYFGAYMTMASGSSDSNEEVCRHFLMTSKCVADSSKNCTADVKMRLEASLHNAKVLMGNTCPLLNTIMCNTSMFYDVMDIKCNGEAAKKCMGDFEQFRNQNRGNMTAICGMYHHTMECLAKNTLTCQEKDTSTFNATVYLTGASIGQECYRLMNQSQMQAVAMRNPMSTTLGMCMEQPECSVLWIHCLGEEMDPEKICGNSAEIRACIHKKLEGCDNNTRLSVVQDVRRFAMDIPAYYNGSCPFADEVIMESNNVTQYFYNNTCLRHFTRNVTAMLNTGSYNNSVSCRLFTSTMAKCLHNETSNPYYPPLYKGIFMSVAQTLREHSCMDLVDMYASDVANGEAMTPEVNASFMAYRMNNSELYNMTFKEPASCQMQTAKMCFEYYASGTTYMGSLPLNDRKMFCKDRAMSFKCVVNATKTCSAMTRHRMMEALYMMASIGHSIGTCNHVDMAAMETRQQNSEMSMTCDQDGALKCLGSLGQAIAMHHMMPTRQSICSHLQPTEMCVIKNTWHCMPEVRKAMESTYNDLKTLAMGACGKADKPKDDMMDSSMECSMKEEEKTCNREAALYCITSAHSKVMADGRTENMCRMMPQLRDCVKKNIMGCDKCQQDTVKQMLSSLYARVAKECPSVMCDKCAAASCMAALNMTHTKSNATCMDVMKTKQCVEMHTKHCETHVSHEMRSHMNEMIMKMKVASCPMDMKFTTCALRFGSVAQQILRIPKDVLPNMEDTTMMCHKCKGAKDNEECNSMPVEYCRGPHQACYTKVDHTDGKHMIHKGCTKRLPMLKSHSCTHNNTRCTYYCDKPGYDESCDTRKAAVCGMTLMHDMLSSGKMDCRKMKEHLYCMSHHTKKCVSVSDQAMHHQVKKVLGSRAMMRCYAEPMPCRCGRCMGMTFMGYVQSITSTDYDVCSMVPAVSKSMMASLIFDDCSGAEVDDMHWSMHYARRVLGDMCGMKPLGIKPYNPKCSIDSAKICLTAVGLKGILRDLPTEHSEDVCKMVYRMLGCAQMHTSECDVRDAVTQIGSHLQDMMSMVHDRCNVSYAWKKLNETQEAIRNNAQLDSFKDAITIKMEDEVEKRIERIQGLMTTAN